MDGKGRQSASPERVLSPSNPFQSALDKDNELISCFNVGQAGNPFARKEHAPCATVLSTVNGPHRKRLPEDTSTAIIDSFFKSRSRYGSESIISGAAQIVEQQPSSGVVGRSHVPKKTVQVSLASLQARKQCADAKKNAILDTKMRNSGGPIDFEPDLESFHQSVGYGQQSGGMPHITITKRQWRTNANGFKPPRIVDPDAHRKFLSRQETGKDGGSREMDGSRMNRESRGTKLEEIGPMDKEKKIARRGEELSVPAEVPSGSIEEINLVDDDDDDDALADVPCREKVQENPQRGMDVEIFRNDSVQCQEEYEFSGKTGKRGSPYQLKGTGVAIFDEFSSEYGDSEDGEDDGMGWDDDGYGSEYENEIAEIEWDNSHQEVRDGNMDNMQAFLKPGSRLENATIIVDGQCQPWWKRLTDFVPISALRSGYDPRDGSKVYIDYMGQFKGTRSKQPDDTGTGGKKKQARTTKTADGYWVTEDGVKSFVTNDGNRLTGKAAYAAYLKKKQGKKPTKKRRRRTKKAAAKRKK